MSIEGARLIIDYDACIRCFCCRELCPHDALEVHEGVILSLMQRFMERR
jgi:formate hydrogenlyase subunit 6/NADH:ubiquinone oxidoreductase subunit I